MPGPADAPVLIVGAGAVGGFLACLFERAGTPVQCMAGPGSAAAIARDGITLDSSRFGHLHCRPAVVDDPRGRPSLVIVATKADGLEAAIARLEGRVDGDAVVLPLLNGCEHIALMRRRLGPAVCAGAIGKVEVYRDGPARVVHATPTALIEVAADDSALAVRLPGVVARLRAIGIEAEQRANEAQVIWDKLVRLCALATTTAASGWPVGAIRDDDAWAVRLAACVEEGAAVAAAEGYHVKVPDVMAKIAGLAAGLETSLQRDIARGVPGELEAIAGAVCRTGARHGLDCPIITALADQARTRCEANRLAKPDRTP